MHPTSYRKLMVTSRTTDFGKAIQIVEVPWQEPGPGEIVVRNLYAGINASLGMFTGGYYPDTPPVPHEVYSEIVSKVVLVGPDVTNLKPGDTVITLGGIISEYQILRADTVIAVPKATSELITLLVSGVTASIALEQAGEMKSGETVLVTAAAGGTGQFAVQLARLAGNRVIGTCGSDEKAAFLKELGCDRVINYREEDLGKVLKAEYPKGVNLVYEGVGRSTFDVCVDNLAVFGRLIVIGSVSDYMAPPQLVTQPRINGSLIFRSASIRGIFVPHFAHLMPVHYDRLLSLYLEGKLKTKVDPTEFKGLEGVINAYEYLHSGKSIGKVIVTYN